MKRECGSREFDVIYQYHKRWIQSNGEDGHQAIFLNRRFFGLRLFELELKNVIFVGCVFYKSDIFDIEFRNCGFSDCEFVDMSFDKIQIYDCAFHDCEFRFSQINRSSIISNYFDKCSIYANNISGNTFLQNSAYEGEIDELCLNVIEDAKAIQSGFDPRFVQAVEENYGDVFHNYDEDLDG